MIGGVPSPGEFASVTVEPRHAVLAAALVRAGGLGVGEPA